MSRIVVKNLPQSGVTEEEIKRHFADIGQVTDIKLKYNDHGCFRRFAFVGFKSADAAQKAIEKLNSTYIKTSKINLELCKAIKEIKPDRLRGAERSNENILGLKSREKGGTKDAKKQKNNKLSESIFEEVEQEPEFKEFLNLQRNLGDKNKINQIWADDVDMKADITKSSDDENVKKDSDTTKSDKPYKRHKRSRGKKNKPAKLKPREIFVHTLKVQGFPDTTRRKDVKDFFKPTELLSVRLNKRDGVCYVSFKDESDLKYAMKTKHLRFYNQTHQIKMWRHDVKKSRIFKETIREKVRQKEEQLNKYEMSSIGTEPVEESGRLFIRNLNYTCTQEDLEEVFREYGELTEVHFPIDKKTSLPKGYAYIEFMFPQNAAEAYRALNGTIFQGRNFHLIPSKPKPDPALRQSSHGGMLSGANMSKLVTNGETTQDKTTDTITEADDNKPVASLLHPEKMFKEEPVANKQSSFKREKVEKLKKEAPMSKPVMSNWNTLFLGSNALADVVSERRGMEKSKLLTQQTHKDPIAVRMALGDAMMVEETRKFLVSNGVELDSFDNPQAPRSRTVMIVKNLPSNVDRSELLQLFESTGGRVSSVILPPNGLTALVEMEEPVQAKLAFKRLAYSKFRDTVLYLEWAPMNVFRERSLEEQEQTDTKQLQEMQTGRTKILVKNVPFEATVPELRKVFGAFGELNFVRMPKKIDGQFRGFCFVDYLTAEDALRAFKSLCHSTHLYGRKLVLEWAKSD